MNKKFIGVKNEGLWSAFSEQQRTSQQILEGDLAKLFDFLKEWKSEYDLFCHEFNCYSWTVDDQFYLYGVECKKELYIDEFFNMIIEKRAKFELEQYTDQKSYNYLESNLKQFDYGLKPNTTTIISGNRFTISGQRSNYRLDINMNPALICSLLVAMSNNYIIYNWYSKQSRFKGFINKVSNDLKYLTFESKSQYYTRAVLCAGDGEDMIIDVDTTHSFLYIIYGNEVVKVENNLHYRHLDKIFGPDRKKPLDEEDLQLYSILNEGKKPTMYDFEF